MATDVQIGVHYDTPIQGGNEPVTRQKGLPPVSQIGVDPQPPPPVIQGDHLNFASRNAGPHVAGQFASDGTFHADRRADEGILFVDHALSDPEAMAPGIARTNTPLPAPSGFGEMTAVQQREAVKQAAIAAGFVVTDSPVEVKDAPTAFAVIASDQPGAGDPRDMSVGPQAFAADQLPQVKKRAIVPVTLTAPNARVKKGKK